MDAEEYRRASLESWQAMAPGWERRRREMEEAAAPVRAWLIRELAPQPGDTVLELAAGPGETGFEAAALVGESGRLISSDMTPAMVDVARRRADELGLRNVEHRVLDAERIELEDDSVDGVLCRWGYMLMPNLAAALSETRRVLRPGGRLALAVWSGPERNPWVSLAGRMLVERGHVTPLGSRESRDVHHGERGADAWAPGECGLHRGAHRRGSRALRERRHRRVRQPGRATRAACCSPFQ